MSNIQFLFSLTAFDVVKWFLVAGLLMYTAFSILIIKQVKVMSEAIEDEFNSLVIMISWINLAAAIFLTVLAVIVL